MIFFAAEASVSSFAVDENYNLIGESFSICNNHQTSELRGKFNVQNYFPSCCFASHARWWKKSIKVFPFLHSRLDPQVWADISCDPPLMSAAKRMVFVLRLNLRANRTLSETSLFTCYTPRNYWLELEENAGKAPLGFSSSPFWFFRFSQNSFAWHWLTNTTIFQALSQSITRGVTIKMEVGTYAAMDLDSGQRSMVAWYFMFSICFLSASRSIFAKILIL